jgi:hypothetical protein
MSQLIKVAFDEFENKTTKSHANALSFQGFFDFEVVQIHSMSLRQVKTSQFQSVLLDVNFRNSDWRFARNGKISFICDQDVLHFPFTETSTDVLREGDHSYCWEYGYYKMTANPKAISVDDSEARAILQKICDAKELKIRIRTDSSSRDFKPEECGKIQTHFREFYREVFDETKYTGGLANSSLTSESPAVIAWKKHLGRKILLFWNWVGWIIGSAAGDFGKGPQDFFMTAWMLGIVFFFIYRKIWITRFSKNAPSAPR